MIIMALDHVRDFFHSGAMFQSPLNMATTTPAVFLTRWITHFCAPVFLFTAGMSACLFLANGGRTKAQLSKFLVLRGLWLILLEVFVIRFALYWSWSSNYPVLLITLWALGASMIVLAALIHLPVRFLAALSVAVILLHNLTDRVSASAFGGFAWLWNVLHQPGAVTVAGRVVILGYPLLPLVATMAAGYCAGHLFQSSPQLRQRTLFRLGGVMILAFALLRTLNTYGDPSHWKVQKSMVMTALSYMNCTKQPASLDFLLMTLGPALILLALYDRIGISESNPLLTYGRVPLFYFVVHFFLIHLIQLAATWFRYGSTPFLFLPPPSVQGPRAMFPPGFGYPLWVAWLVWVFVVLAMYPACRWFSKRKAQRRDWWLSYL